MQKILTQYNICYGIIKLLCILLKLIFSYERLIMIRKIY